MDQEHGMEKMTTDILDRKLNILLNKFITARVEFGDASSIQDDLGIYGDDAMELLLEYSEIFKVDISEFPFNTVFRDEGDPILLSIIKVFLGKWKNKRYLPFTVLDLKEGIIEGKLVI